MKTSRLLTTASVLAPLAAMVLAACHESRSAPQLPAMAAHDSTQVWLAVSDTAPAVGGTVKVSAQLVPDADSANRIVSFNARVAFDSSALAYIEDGAVADGAMRASNALGTEVRVAGAALDGFSTGLLFSAHFRVLKRDGLRSLRLTLDELKNSSGGDMRNAKRVAKGVALAAK